jgi:hypothetical protein
MMILSLISGKSSCIPKWNFFLKIKTIHPAQQEAGFVITVRAIKSVCFFVLDCDKYVLLRRLAPATCTYIRCYIVQIKLLCLFSLSVEGTSIRSEHTEDPPAVVRHMPSSHKQNVECSLLGNYSLLFCCRNMGSFWIEGTIGAIKALAFVCDILTYPVYLILQRPWEKKAMSRRVKVSTLSVVVHVYSTEILLCQCWSHC